MQCQGSTRNGRYAGRSDAPRCASVRAGVRVPVGTDVHVPLSIGVLAGVQARARASLWALVCMSREL